MGVIIVALIAVIVILLIKDNNTDNREENNIKTSDALKFAEEYSLVGKDNVFVYTDVDKIIDILENGTGVVYLNEVAKERNISQIYYYNIREDRSNNSENYLKIVDILKDYLQDDEEGNPRIYVPAVIFMSDGKIIGFDDETSLDTKGCSTPSEYWTKDEINDLKDRLNSYIDYSNICLDCNS